MCLILLKLVQFPRKLSEEGWVSKNVVGSKVFNEGGWVSKGVGCSNRLVCERGECPRGFCVQEVVIDVEND